MNEILHFCLMVLVVIGNTSGRWTRKSEDAKDLKDEKENMKEVFAHWQENISNKIYTTTTSTSTMPPTTSSATIPRTIPEEELLIICFCRYLQFLILHLHDAFDLEKWWLLVALLMLRLLL